MSPTSPEAFEVSKAQDPPYFNRFTYLTESDLRNLQVAYHLAWYASFVEGRPRESDGEPAFSHCREVSIILFDELGIHDPICHIVALLHDVAREDSTLPWVLPRLLYGERVDLLLTAVSIPGKTPRSGPTTPEQLAAYYGQLETGFINAEELTPEELFTARCVVLADKLHQMRKMENLPLEKVSRKVNEVKDRGFKIIGLVDEHDSSIATKFRSGFESAINNLNLSLSFG